MFDVVRLVHVESKQLTSAFEAKKAELGGKELTVFHGTQVLVTRPLIVVDCH